MTTEKRGPGRPRKPKVAKKKGKPGRPRKDRTGRIRLGGYMDANTHGQLKSRAALHRIPFEQYLDIIARWYLIKYAAMGTPPEEEPTLPLIEKRKTEPPKEDARKIRLGGYMDEDTHAQLKSRAALHRITFEKYLETISRWYLMKFAPTGTPPNHEPIFTLIELVRGK